MIRAIAAIDDKRGIARDSVIPWKITEDTQYFREHTEHSIVLMGHDTYKEFEQPLPNRRNLVASRKLAEVREGFELVTDVDAFLKQAIDDVWIIGGAGLYAATLDFCDELYLTHVKGDYGCDRFFPTYEHYKVRSQSPIKRTAEFEYQFIILELLKNR